MLYITKIFSNINLLVNFFSFETGFNLLKDFLRIEWSRWFTDGYLIINELMDNNYAYSPSDSSSENENDGNSSDENQYSTALKIPGHLNYGGIFIT